MDKTAKWILRWLIVGIFFVSAENSKCQESPTNSIQQTNQTNTYKAPAAFPPDCQAYDQKLISKITHQVNDLIYKTNNIFLDPQKKVVITFKLHPDGGVSDLKIIENSNTSLATVCIRAIKDCAPFPKWPEKMRSIVNQDYREITFTF